MRLSTLITDRTRQGDALRFTDEGLPIWLWHAARKRDLPWIRAEGLIWGPTVWLASTRKAAIGFHPAADRLIIRVATDQLDSAKLQRNASWRQWLGGLRQSKASGPPPAALVLYWARLRKYHDVDSSKRLRSAAAGSYDPKQLKTDLRTQIARVRPDQLWEYPPRIPPSALSVANEAGFYDCLRPPKEPGSVTGDNR